MRSPGIIAVSTALIVLMAFCAAPSESSDQSGPWRGAQGRWAWSFPADHGSHPAFQTEWWYFTGNLRSAQDQVFGYQLTFFRTGIRPEPPLPSNPWSVRDLYLGHFTLTDQRQNDFYWTERVSRTGPGLAGAAEGRLEVWLHDWKAVQTPAGIRLQARSGDRELYLDLIPRKSPVLHGTQGLSLKGSGPGQASFYYSMTDLGTEGLVRLPDGETIKVEGRSWFDHEFGSSQLTEEQAGWDWFGLHLSDGNELMIYLMRRADGTVEAMSSGTLISNDGSPTHLPLDDFSVRATGTWESPASGATYPSGWRIIVPGAGLDIQITPLVRDQELITRATAGITYWEGAVSIKGRSGDKDITGGGYVELTGYAGSLGGLF